MSSRWNNDHSVYLGTLRYPNDSNYYQQYTTAPGDDWFKFSSNGRKDGSGHYIGGGAFVTQKSDLRYTQGKLDSIAGGQHYAGSVVAIPQPTTLSMPRMKGHIRNPAEVEGAHAYAHAKARLVKPIFSFTQPLAELKDVKLYSPSEVSSAIKALKSDVRDFKNFIREVADNIGSQLHTPEGFDLKKYRSLPKKSGEYYLSTFFGWVPIASDIRNFLTSLPKAQKRTHNLIRKNSKVQTLKGVLHDISEANRYSDVPFVPLLPHLHPFHFGNVKVTVEEAYTHRVWYSGKFVTVLPEGKPFTYPPALTRALRYDNNITPSTVYNLTPWTWLLDYFSETGMMFDALSDGVADFQVADTFFVMRHESNITTTTVKYEYQKDGSTSSSSASTTVRNVSKARAIASPFGFGFNPESLSGFQKGILAALALSKQRP